MDETGLAGPLRDQATRHSVPGAAIGVLRGGGSTATAAIGVADVLDREPVTLDTRFAVGSPVQVDGRDNDRVPADAGRLSAARAACTETKRGGVDGDRSHAWASVRECHRTARTPSKITARSDRASDTSNNTTRMPSPMLTPSSGPIGRDET